MRGMRRVGRDCNRREEPGLSRRTTGEARNTSSSPNPSVTGGNQFERRAPHLLGKAGFLLEKHIQSMVSNSLSDPLPERTIMAW